MIDKLQIDEAQMEMVREVMGERRQAQRDSGRAFNELMKAARARLLPNQGNNGRNGGNDPNGQNGGNDPNGQNGGNGGNGGRRGGRFDPEAMKKVMEDPQVKAQMEQSKAQNEKIDNQFSLAVAKVMTQRQRAIYKKMLGAPFDRTQMFGAGGPWGGRRGNGPGNQANTKNGAPAGKADTAAKPDTSDDDEGTTSPAAAAKPAASAPAKAKAATTSKRRSLREQRGVPDDSDN